MDNIDFEITQIKNRICSIKIFEYQPLCNLILSYDIDNILGYLFANNYENIKIYGHAIENGDLLFVKLIHFKYPELITIHTMDDAAANGYLNVVQWLHENREEGCTTYAMNYAARNGHLDVVQWLKSNIPMFADKSVN